MATEEEKRKKREQDAKDNAAIQKHREREKKKRDDARERAHERSRANRAGTGVKHDRLVGWLGVSRDVDPGRNPLATVGGGEADLLRDPIFGCGIARFDLGVERYRVVV